MASLLKVPNLLIPYVYFYVYTSIVLVFIKGSQCTSPCQFEDGWLSEYNFCWTSNDESSWEYCGDSDVPEDKKSIVEFTWRDNVCADYCQAYKGKLYFWTGIGDKLAHK